MPGRAAGRPQTESRLIPNPLLPRLAAEPPAGGGPVPVPVPLPAPGGQAADPLGLSAWWNWWLPATAASAPDAAASSEPVAPVPLPVAPQRLAQLQTDYFERLSSLWSDFLEHPERTSAPIKDGRFADPAWQHNSLASFYARAYLLNAEFMNELAASVEADPKLKARVRFAVSQWIDASAPSNFLAMNPAAQQRLIDTKGESLASGLQNLLEDIGKGKVSQADESAFEVGRNVATTEGAVVFENELMQLIQYRPLTPTVRARPFLLVPPCINKFYILDLQPENSFIRYGVERGNTLFVVSWKNAQEEDGHWRWDDYLELGPIAALNVVREITGAGKVNALGFCVGGTLIAAAIAVLRARGDDPIASLTLLTALLDFQDTGILDIFIDESHVQLRERTLGQGGLMPGRDLANTFSSLRANDLVWNYVVNNYLQGRQPPAFDLLYWNGDSTNLPGPMYAWYLRNMYLENRLREPGALVCCGVPVDLARIDVPAYVFAAREDHIVPWRGAYASALALRGVPALRFVLGASGHIAGTINPASKNRRSYWVAEPGPLAGDGEAWLQAAQEHTGSWWPDWDAWLAGFADGEVPAPPHYGSAKYPAIEPAPGRYVRQKA